MDPNPAITAHTVTNVAVRSFLYRTSTRQALCSDVKTMF